MWNINIESQLINGQLEIKTKDKFIKSSRFFKKHS